MKLKSIAGLALAAGMLFSCAEEAKETKKVDPYEPKFIEIAENGKMEFKVEEFGDVDILRYEIPGFNELTLKEKKLVYYLTQAGLSGRDIIWDQNYRHNLEIRSALENVYVNCL
jgi:dipeptidyl-peptidase-3